MSNDNSSRLEDALNYLAGVDEQPTLRDQFAMAAMPAIIGLTVRLHHPDDIAQTAFEIADAMLAARKALVPL